MFVSQLTLQKSIVVKGSDVDHDETFREASEGWSLPSDITGKDLENR